MPWGCYSGTTAEMISADGYPNRFQYLFYPFLDIDGPICMNLTIKWIFLSFLLALQVLSIIWFFMIVRVAVGVLRTGNAEDTRSDDEEESEISSSSLRPSAAGAASSRRNQSRKKDHSAAATLGMSAADAAHAGSDWSRANGSPSVRTRGRGRVRLTEQSDRKALLGRIGCDKPTN